MVRYKRTLDIQLPKGQSAFLWGARKTGKTSFLKNRFPESIVFDFLKTDLFIEMSARPYLLRERLESCDNKKLDHPVILDEVQKVPQILDEVHWLIENRNLSFILCGSSARKLKRGQANLLGGRAWRYEMFPLCYKEINNFDLLTALNRGLIPDHYLEQNYRKSLKAYTEDYLKEEVFAEGLTRNVPAFSRFFEAVGYTHGELTNFASIARDCAVSAKTVKEYYQILADTHLGTMLEPFKKQQRRQVISSAPKFYLFDVGVAGSVTGRIIKEERGIQFGKALEHFILLELIAHRSYSDLGYSINFWRTKNGLEVDFILNNGEVAIEVKGSPRVDARELNSIKAFSEEHSPERSMVVCNEREPRTVGKIEILPWKLFLEKLWSGSIVQG